MEAPSYLQETFELSKVYHIKRIRYANEIAMRIEHNYYPMEIGKELIKFDLNHATLYDLLENKLGIHSIEAD